MKKLFTRDIKLVWSIALSAIILFVGGSFTFNYVVNNSNQTSGQTIAIPVGDGKVPTDNPTPPGDTFALPVVNKSGETPPVISGVTAQGGPNESIIIQGEGFSKDLSGQKVWVYAQTKKNNKSLYQAQITAGDENTITAVIKQSMPYSMYMVYVENSNGISNEFFVNTPQIWWIGQTLANEGGSSTIYGANLTSENDNKVSYVYLRPVGAKASVKSVAAKISYADPYKVTFEIPKGLKAEEEYEVWLHNGHGGAFGWVLAPESLKITAKPLMDWNDVKRDVTTFGANAKDENNDDSAAIQAAIDAAQNGDTVYFPAGTYKIGKEITCKKSFVKFLGDPSGKTIIVADPSYKGQTLIRIETIPFEMEGMNFKSTRSIEDFPSFISLRGDGFPIGNPNIIIEKCKFEMVYTGKGLSFGTSVSISNMYNAYIQNCEFEAPSSVVGSNCNKVYFTNNNFVGNFYIIDENGPDVFHMVDSNMADVSNNKFTAKDYLTDQNGTLEVGDYGINRCSVFQGASAKLYVASNEIKKAGNPVNNSGEQIMFEDPSTLFIGHASKIIDTKISFDDPLFVLPGKGSVISIVNGKGQAQYRRIRSSKGNTVTLEKPFDIQPDETSLFHITRPFIDVAVYNNKIDGYKNALENANAGSGIQAYGNLINFHVRNNEFSNYMYGVLLTSHYSENGFGEKANKLSNIFLWTIVDDNKISNVRFGVSTTLVYLGSPTTNPIPQHSVFNTVIRGNSVTNAKYSPSSLLTELGGNAFTVGTNVKVYTNWNETSTWEGDWIRFTVIENNTVNGTDGAPINIQKHQGFTVLRNNKFEGKNSENPVKYDSMAQQAILVN